MTTTSSERTDLLTVFLRKSGYSREDVLGHNPKTGVFATKNGGKYSINRKTGKLRHLSGPPLPSSE